jgi:hypothetical protein
VGLLAQRELAAAEAAADAIAALATLTDQAGD